MPDIFVAEKKPRKSKPKLEKTSSPLAAFLTRPKNIRFETQAKKEEIVLLLRRHWLTNVPWILIACLMISAPNFLRLLPLLDFLPGRFQLIAWLAWYMLVIAFVLEKSLSWLFNVNIITDERVIDIDFPSMLYRDVSATKIDQIQDISVKVGGFVRSLFDFGDVLVQTASAVPEICFEAVPHPDKVAKVLDKLILEEEKEKLAGRAR